MDEREFMVVRCDGRHCTNQIYLPVWEYNLRYRHLRLFVYCAGCRDKLLEREALDPDISQWEILYEKNEYAMLFLHSSTSFNGPEDRLRLRNATDEYKKERRNNAHPKNIPAQE